MYLLTILKITRCSGGRNELTCISTSDMSCCNISFKEDGIINDIIDEVVYKVLLSPCLHTFSTIKHNLRFFSKKYTLYDSVSLIDTQSNSHR